MMDVEGDCEEKDNVQHEIYKSTFLLDHTYSHTHTQTQNTFHSMLLFVEMEKKKSRKIYVRAILLPILMVL